MGIAAILFSRTPEGMLCPPVPSTHPIGYFTDCIRYRVMGAEATAFLKLGSSEFAVELRSVPKTQRLAASCLVIAWLLSWFIWPQQGAGLMGRLILLPPPPTAQVGSLGG